MQVSTQCHGFFKAGRDVRSRTDGMYYTGRVIGTSTIWHCCCCCSSWLAPHVVERGADPCTSHVLTLTCGIHAAVCRHGCPMKGCNLIKTGERYAYTHYLLTEHLLSNEHLKYIYLDIACRYDDWAHRCARLS